MRRGEEEMKMKMVSRVLLINRATLSLFVPLLFFPFKYSDSTSYHHSPDGHTDIQINSRQQSRVRKKKKGGVKKRQDTLSSQPTITRTDRARFLLKFPLARTLSWQLWQDRTGQGSSAPRKKQQLTQDHSCMRYVLQKLVRGEGIRETVPRKQEAEVLSVTITTGRR
ncbi:hypothetical protein ASPWEDRAFT_696065 [Aspergillus wentii DTO 134E9]|uniref:Uncharacterized protein n=1 Tax=Aspergillus wentii DTO 134E9 TaxID=1073089 RepID=A0A1L9R9E0_ASPWE|nr:uncharacterized protein ASPWEDRAFT_696065 [Aspergillus wentii DTO 134E9]OJJ31545.1 hypothetical protein ASPWEDRAFT_696065 [Aspergillus wentii DTO 134E9]